jgi:hypothetical protein
MASKKKRESSSSEMVREEAEMNMTPMIDVVFNLIIFFMVITDMTQKDLEYLILPKASMADEDDGNDPKRLVVNVVNPGLLDENEHNFSSPPIYFQGSQMKSFQMLRERLFEAAPPTEEENQQKEYGGRSLNYQGVYPSNRSLLIRCDQSMEFAWVQAILNYILFVPPGEKDPRAAIANKSPLIWKVEIAAAAPKKD